MKCRPLAGISLDEGWVECDGGFGILEGVVGVALFEVGGGTVGVVDVIGAVGVYGLGVGFDGFG